MNDKELDEMLDRWQAPETTASLRQRVMAELAPVPRRRFAWPTWRTGRGLLFATASGAAVLLLVVGIASPESLGFGKPSPVRLPFLAASRVFVYADDGSSRLDATIWSSSYKGTEIVINEQHPNDPIHGFLKNFHDAVHLLALRYLPGVVFPQSAAGDAAFAAYVRSGCVGKGDTVVGHEAILGHATTAVQQVNSDGVRWSDWRAPDLGCFMLGSTDEVPSNGRYRLVKRRETVNLVMTRAWR